MRKPDFRICENKDADQRLCFRYTDGTIPLLLNPKTKLSSHLLLIYSPVCVGPDRKPRSPVFSRRGSYSIYMSGELIDSGPIRTLAAMAT